jgi:hypothetical protein
MTKLDPKVLETAGFKLDKNENIITMQGRKVSAELAEGIASGAVLGNFSMDDLMKKKTRASNNGTSDLVGALRKISPYIEKLAVGQTAKIKMPEPGQDGKDPKRAFVMSVVTKLNNLTAKGREWAGQKFQAASDPEGQFLYVARLEDGEPVERKTGGGRSKKASQDKLAAATAAVETKLEGAKEDDKPSDGNPAIEEATVITH